VETYDRTRSGRRTFRVSYIKDAELLPESYTPRAEMADLDPTLGGEVGSALVLFARERARYEVEERPEARRLPDGRALARITYGSHGWLVTEIMRRRGSAVLLEPRALRPAVVEAAETLLAEIAAIPAA
jgi:predicted DNA-binding transcriptional regulator YafY